MNENFITNIFVENVRNIKDLKISLSNTHRQHLIITGKNGSGKTSLLLELERFLTTSFDRSFSETKKHHDPPKGEFVIHDGELLDEDGNRHFDNLSLFGNVQVSLSTRDRLSHDSFLFVFFGAKRASLIEIPQGISAIDYKTKGFIAGVGTVGEIVGGPTKKTRLSHLFLQYLVNLKADRSFARDDQEMEKVKKIDDWFTNFETRLKDIFEDTSLQLKFDNKNYNFDILIEGQEPFGFDRLSDGYASIIEIVSELLLQSEALDVKAYELEGIVLIDEIETHLHVSLQKKILPFLIDFFPRVQFIVTTHSPFVISSISNATICDLDSRECIEDLSSYSYDALIESFFDSDKYSDVVKHKIKIFEELTLLPTRSPEQDEKLLHLQDYFRHAPKYLSEELHLKLQQIDLAKLDI